MWPEVMCLLQHSCEDDAIGAGLGAVIWVGLLFYSGFANGLGFLHQF